MKKLKQSSALLLIVSFLLSVFSFSAFAAGDIKINICPRLLTEEEAKDKVNKEGNPGGKPITNAHFKFYKVGDINDQYEVPKGGYTWEDFPYDKNQKEHVQMVRGQEFVFYSDDEKPKEVTTDEHGVGSITFTSDEGGWFIGLMDDMEEQTCVPTLIGVNPKSNEKERYVYPKAVDLSADHILPNIRKYIVTNNETKWLSNSNVLNNGEITYFVDVDAPKLEANYRDQKDYRNALNSRYSIFKVYDNALTNNKLVEGLADNSVKVTLVGNGGLQDNVLYQFDPRHGAGHGQQGDYILNIGNGKKSFSVDFRRGNDGFSENLSNQLWTYRKRPDVRLRISFKVKLKNIKKYFFDEVKKKLDNNGVGQFFSQLNSQPGSANLENIGFNEQLKNNISELCSVKNNATLEVKKGQNNKNIDSNTVISQFGVLCVRKMDNKGNQLNGSEFDLYSDDPNLNNKDNKPIKSDYLDEKNGDRYFVVNLGKGVRYDGSYVNANNDELNKKAEDDYTQGQTYYLKETQAPEGYELLKKPHQVTCYGGFNYEEVKNFPRIMMPFTGGVGTILFTAVGILLIGSGAFLYMNSRRKRSAK